MGNSILTQDHLKALLVFLDRVPKTGKAETEVWGALWNIAQALLSEELVVVPTEQYQDLTQFQTFLQKESPETLKKVQDRIKAAKQAEKTRGDLLQQLQQLNDPDLLQNLLDVANGDRKVSKRVVKDEGTPVPQDTPAAPVGPVC